MFEEVKWCTFVLKNTTWKGQLKRWSAKFWLFVSLLYSEEKSSWSLLDLISNQKRSCGWFLWKLIAIFFQVLGLLLFTCPPIHTCQFYKTVQHLQKPLKFLEQVWYLIKFFVSSPSLSVMWGMKQRIWLNAKCCLTLSFYWMKLLV